MNIFIRELKASLKSTLIWSISIVIFVFMAMVEFSGYAGNTEILKVIESMPPALISAFEMNSFNLTTIEGFFGIMVTFLALIFTVHAVMLGSSIISKEERDKTAEFILSLPIPRHRLITGKVLVAITNCIVLLIVAYIIFIISAAKYKPDSVFYEFLILSFITLFCLQLIFLGIGLFLASVLKQYKKSSSIAVSLLLITYFMSIIMDLSDKFEFFKYITPFKFFDYKKMLNELTIDINYVIISVVIFIVFLAGSYITYSKRDLYI